MTDGSTCSTCDTDARGKRLYMTQRPFSHRAFVLAVSARRFTFLSSPDVLFCDGIVFRPRCTAAESYFCCSGSQSGVIREV